MNLISRPVLYKWDFTFIVHLWVLGERSFQGKDVREPEFGRFSCPRMEITEQCLQGARALSLSLESQALP